MLQVLKRVIPVAVDRAIREIIQPVVERSVTIACITSKELVQKDFAMEADDHKMRKVTWILSASCFILDSVSQSVSIFEGSSVCYYLVCGKLVGNLCKPRGFMSSASSLFDVLGAYSRRRTLW